MAGKKGCNDMDANVMMIVAVLSAIILIVLIMAVIHISSKSDEMCKILDEINQQMHKLGKDSAHSGSSNRPGSPTVYHGDWICKSCGTKNSSNSSYCKDCGKYK